jgi:hypothetical protein
MSRTYGLDALEQLAPPPEQCTHELPLRDGLFRLSPMAIVAVSGP